MRPLLLCALLLCACGPRVVARFTWAQPHTDVLWLKVDGKLARCHLNAHGPVCFEVKSFPGFDDFRGYNGGMPAAGMPPSSPAPAAQKPPAE